MIAALARQVAARYQRRATQGFVRGKLRGDPVLPALLALPPLGAVVDLGCGRGQLGLALLLAGRADSLAGFDLDAGKIAQAASASHGLQARFAVADLAGAAVPHCDTVLLIDVLLQMSRDAQGALLERIAAAAPSSIVIRAFDPDRGWRSAAGSVMERARRALGADLGRRGAFAPLPVREIAHPLGSAGYRVTVAPCWAGTPLPNVLILAQRP